MARATLDQPAPRSSPALDDSMESWTSAEMRQRFVEYAQTRDRGLRNELIEAHRPLAIALARRYAGRGEPLDDLVQTGMLGLLKAVEGFDPGRGIKFVTYAMPTIIGTLKRHFRDTTWAVHVPRRPQELHARISAARESFAHRRGRLPTVTEVATELGVPEHDVLEALQVAASYRTVAFDIAPSDGSRRDDDRHLRVDEPGFAAVERRSAIQALLTRLPDRERTVVRLRFVDEMTQSDIARLVGLSQMQISRLLQRSLTRMRAHAREHLDA
jgi:RNA polymerase sigma-B factor